MKQGSRGKEEGVDKERRRWVKEGWSEREGEKRNSTVKRRERAEGRQEGRQPRESVDGGRMAEEEEEWW